jgi:hypothetical protein
MVISAIDYPDFIVKLTTGTVVIMETKGLVDVDVPHKMQRLAQWVSDLNALQSQVIDDFAFVDERQGHLNQHKITPRSIPPMPPSHPADASTLPPPAPRQHQPPAHDRGRRG